MTSRRSFDIQKIIELKNSGLNWNEIAKHFNATRESVRSFYRTNKHQPEYSEDETTSYEEGYDFINVVCASQRMLSVEDIIKQFKIDTSIWEVDRFKVKTSEGYRKDRSVQWKVEAGKVLHGDVNDTGKMLVVPLYHIEVRLKKIIAVIDAKAIIASMKEDALKYAPKYPVIQRDQNKTGFMYEFAIPDMHFGKLTWSEETGIDYDINIAYEIASRVIDKLLSYTSGIGVEKILFPIGNDFFNVDNKDNTTVHGTPQQEDTRWQKTFRKGRELCVNLIDMCATVADVDVIIIPGNHDEQRSFYLGDSLECWYHNSKNVHVDNSPISRKYYAFGKNLIGFTHGYDERPDKLPFLMPLEQPELWAKSTYREWHTGDKHQKKDTLQYASEGSGMLVRILRSLSATDRWHFNKGFVGTLRAGEAFAWHKEDGLVAQYTATAR